MLHLAGFMHLDGRWLEDCGRRLQPSLTTVNSCRATGNYRYADQRQPLVELGE
jgi:hypothetical protein